MRLKGFAPIIVVVALVILGVAGFFAYTGGYFNPLLATLAPQLIPKSSISSPAPPSRNDDINSAALVPDGAAVVVLNGQKYRISKIGDKLGSLKVIEYGQVKVGMYVITFKGEIEITAKYIVNSDNNEGMDSLLNNRICLSDLDNKSLSRLPQLEIDERSAGFCFSNVEESQNIFKGYPKYGTATVTIDNYTINYAPMEVYNSAVLKRLVSVK